MKNTLKQKNVQELNALIDILKSVNGLKQEVTSKGMLNVNNFMLLLLMKMRDHINVKTVQTYGVTKTVWCNRISMANNFICV